jgi:FkbM family methyltransferase
LSYRFIRFLEHIRRGTIIDRLRWEWKERIKRRRRLWWESHRGRLESFESRLGYSIRLRLYLDSELARLIYCESFEIREREFLRAFLKPGDIFVDVGANIGLYTLIAASCVRESGLVYSFEPTEKTFKSLRENVKLNGFSNIRCYQLALSNETGNFPFYISEDGYDAWNSFSPPIAGKNFSKQDIECQRWDDFAREHDLVDKVTMMKIDVEGWESRLLAGAFSSFARTDAPILQVEFTDEAASSAGSSCQELYHALERMGYRMYTYDPKNIRLVHDPMREHYPYVNLFAVKHVESVNERIRSLPFWRRFQLGL